MEAHRVQGRASPLDERASELVAQVDAMADSGIPLGEGAVEAYMGGWPFSFDFTRKELEDDAFWLNWLRKWPVKEEWKQ